MPGKRTADSELAQLIAQYPDDREDILLEEAADAAQDGDYGRALALYEQLLQTGSENPELVEAYRISTLWDAGRVAEARAAAGQLRAGHPHDAGAWMVVAEMFEAAEELTTAAEWYTAGLTHVLGAGAPPTVASVVGSPDEFGTETLAVGRHRVRRLLDQPHDDLDELAHQLHDNRAQLVHSPRSLDELHSPERLRAMRNGEPDELAESLTRRDTPLDLDMAAVAYWPADEFAALLARWPELADDYGHDHAAHQLAVERALRDLSERGATRLGLASATVAGLAAYAEDDQSAPTDRDLRASYADDLGALGQVRPWPPGRNDACWCGSGTKYKKCHGRPMSS